MHIQVGRIIFGLNVKLKVMTKCFRSFYCNQTGIGYNFMRIPIGGSDFDLTPWTYMEATVEDQNLTNFTKLDHRDLERVSTV